MIIPIIIPIHHYDDEDSHHRGCQCPECLEKKKWNDKPREYYEERCAVPKRWYYKNLIIKIIRIIFVLISFAIIISPLFFKSPNFYLLPILVIGGAFLMLFSIIFIDKYIKYDFQCKDKIRLERKKYSWNDSKSWDDIIREANLPKNYIVGKIREEWRYKKIS